MAEELLVDDRIDGGQKMVDQLLADGFDITVAFWSKKEEGSWRLYLASPGFDDRRPGENFLAIHESLARLPDEIRFESITTINDQNPAALAALKIAGRVGKAEGIRYRGTRLGNLTIEEAYVYPRPAIPLRQAFTVTYVRQGETDDWEATIRPGKLHRGLRHKGLVASAHAPGDRPEDHRFASVSVLIEVDPSLDEQAIAREPVIREMLLEQARSLADHRFKKDDPTATIHHHDAALTTA